MSRPVLGPAGSATIVTSDLDHSIAAYTQHLEQKVHRLGTLDAHHAEALDWPALTGARTAWLANELDEPWLHFIEATDAAARTPFTHYGWMSLEISVQDVDALALRLADSPFSTIGPPADLAMSDAIRAMQVTGPSGEVLYLTEVKRPVPPFELALPRCRVDRLFIPVTVSPNREASLAHFAGLARHEGLLFDTRITVINRAHDFPIDREHPVATLQLAGETLIEIDQLAGLEHYDSQDPCPATGIALIHFTHPGAPTLRGSGPGGERYTLSNNTQGLPL